MENNQQIWQVVHSIPRGKVATYGQIAKLADLPGYARFVGQVMKSLPSDSKLPWHRVLNAKGRLSFPHSSEQYKRQQSLLEGEGIVFINGRISLKKYSWWP